MNTQFKKGILDLCVLSILADDDCYGYEIVSKIVSYIEISDGSIYPLLRRFKNEEYVTSYLQESIEGPPRKYYTLTQKGKETYEKLHHEWFQFQSSINQLIQNKEVI